MIVEQNLFGCSAILKSFNATVLTLRPIFFLKGCVFLQPCVQPLFMVMMIIIAIFTLYNMKYISEGVAGPEKQESAVKRT